MMLESRCERLSAWLLFFLFFGFVWFVGGLAFAPSNKIYQQGLVLLFWLPALILLGGFVLQGRSLGRISGLFVAFSLLACWAVLSLSWSEAAEGVREFKRVVYISFFMFLCFIFGFRRPEWISSMLWTLSFGACCIMLFSVFDFLLEGGDYLSRRLTPLGGYGHPILGGYALIALSLYFLVWAFLKSRFLSVASFLVALFFVFMTQSRGLIGAYVFSVMALVCWFGGRKLAPFWSVFLILLSVLIVVFWDVLLARGGSYRLEIFSVGMSMIAQQPWLGMGLGSSYDIAGGESGLVFDNVHNLVLHFAIELGVVGALLWSMLWFLVLRLALILRSTAEGAWLCALWLFSSVACLTDVAYSWNTPAAEWFVTWWPVGAAFMLLGGVKAGQSRLEHKTV